MNITAELDYRNAKAIIEATGYHRRDAELQEIEDQLKDG